MNFWTSGGLPFGEPKNLTQRRGKHHELLITSLLAGQNCAIKLGFATDYGG